MFPGGQLAAIRAVGQRGEGAGRRAEHAADRLGQRLDQAVAGPRRRVQPPGRPGQQRRGDRISVVQGGALRGQPLRRDLGVLPGRGGPRGLDRYPRPGQRGHDHHCRERGQRPGGAAGPSRGRPLARRNSASPVPSGGYRPGSAAQTRAACPARPAARRGTAARGRRRCPATAPRPRRAGRTGPCWPRPRPATPAAAARPGAARRAGSRTGRCPASPGGAGRTPPAPRRPGAIRPRAARSAARSGADRAADRAAVRPGRGPAGRPPGRGLLVLGQAPVGRLGADRHGPGDPGPGPASRYACLLSSLPRRCSQRASWPGTPAAGRPVPGRLRPGRAQPGHEGLGQGRLDGQAAGLGRAGDHPPQLGLRSSARHDLVALHHGLALRVGRAPVPAVTAHREDREQREAQARGPAGRVAARAPRSTNAARCAARPRRPRPRRPARTGR